MHQYVLWAKIMSHLWYTQLMGPLSFPICPLSRVEIQFKVFSVGKLYFSSFQSTLLDTNWLWVQLIIIFWFLTDCHRQQGWLQSRWTFTTLCLTFRTYGDLTLRFFIFVSGPLMFFIILPRCQLHVAPSKVKLCPICISRLLHFCSAIACFKPFDISNGHARFKPCDTSNVHGVKIIPSTSSGVITSNLILQCHLINSGDISNVHVLPQLVFKPFDISNVHSLF